MLRGYTFVVELPSAVTVVVLDVGLSQDIILVSEERPSFARAGGIMVPETIIAQINIDIAHLNAFFIFNIPFLHHLYLLALFRK